MEKRDNNICYWDGCHLKDKFKSLGLLLAHIKTMILKQMMM